MINTTILSKVDQASRVEAETLASFTMGKYISKVPIKFWEKIERQEKNLKLSEASFEIGDRLTLLNSAM